MNKYGIEIKETLSRIVSIDAESKEEALYLAKGMYKKEEYVLDADDFVGVDFSVMEEMEIENSQNFIYFDFKTGVEKLKDMKKNEFYGYDISGNGYADIFLLKKEKDTLWVCSLLAKHGDLEDKTLLSNYEIADNQHCLMKYEALKFMTCDLFYKVYLELYDAVMQKKPDIVEPTMYVVDVDLEIQDLNVKLLHDLYKEHEESEKHKEVCK